MSQSGLRIFISYARADSRELAVALHDDLKSVGHSPWLDLAEIPGGADWIEAIETAIDAADIALVLLSHGATQSKYCRAEQLRALRKGSRVIPILVQADAEPPLHLEHLNYLDFSAVEQYHAKLRDLLSDITAGRAFQMQPTSKPTLDHADGRFGPRKAALGKLDNAEKRDAAAFRRHIAALRSESWLENRYWWPYFLFTFMDVQQVVSVLEADMLLPEQSAGRTVGRGENRLADQVRLYFRPRTPDLWGVEGIRPALRRRGRKLPVPVYLLFDLESIVCQKDVRFSTGDPLQTRRTYTTASKFSELPFDMIYHDTAFRAEEKEEILESRRAQVLVPGHLGLESLQYIVLRSRAEYETLRTLLTASVWAQWRDKITLRTDLALFHRRWTFVEDALLTASRVVLRFNLPDESHGTFDMRVMLTDVHGQQHCIWQESDFNAQDDFLLDLGPLGGSPSTYTLHVYLDDALAYAGRYAASNGIL